MKSLKQKVKLLTKTALFCIGFIVSFFVLSLGVHMAKAAWEEPAAYAPEGNVYSQINVGADDQTKQGKLLLNPLYNPYDTLGALPAMNYQLEVLGQGAFFTDLEATDSLVVDTDTLYINTVADKIRVGIGTTAPDPVSLLNVMGGKLTVGTSDNLVSGAALSVTSSKGNAIYGQAQTASVAGAYGYSTTGTGYGVYGFSESGYGVYGRNDSTSALASAVVGSTAADYDQANIIAGIYGRATGLGSWAGYFEQRLYGSDQVIGRKFVPNRLQNSQIPYTAGWEVRDIVDSELVSLDVMTFDGTYIWAHGGEWNENNPEFIAVINPDTMEIVEKIVLYWNGEHNFKRIINAGGYIWAAHNHSCGGGCEIKSAITRIDPNDDFSYETYVIGPTLGDSYSEAVDMFYDTTTSGGPYLWVLNSINRADITSVDTRHFITQMQTDGTVVRSFSIDAAANGGNKCDRYNMYRNPTNCSDWLDNDNDGNIDNGLCVFNTPINETECTTAGGNWAKACSDRTFNNFTDCQNGGEIWAQECSSSACPTQNECLNCSGGTWDPDTGCSDSNCITEDTCIGTITCGDTWVAPDPQCSSHTDLGSCSDPSCTTWGDCIGTGSGQCSEFAAATWTWNTPANDERIVTAYIGAPKSMTFDGEYIWMSFNGAPSWAEYGYAGEAYARFKASDPENPAEQYVYCTGPATRPYGIAYDEVNDLIWMPYAPSRGTDNRGIAKVYAHDGAGYSAGDMFEFLLASQAIPGHTAGDPLNGIRYYPSSPGGPSMWVYSGGNLIKVDPDDNTMDHAYSDAANQDFYDWDFDTRDSNNPAILQLTGPSGAVLKHTMDDPPGYSTTTSIIIGARVAGIIFDGTYIWTANVGTNSISQYRASDGVKIGDYNVRVNPSKMVFDGSSIWFPYHYYGSKFIKFDIGSGNVDEYSVTAAGGYSFTGNITDVAFDGNNVWLTSEHEDHLVKIDLSACDDVAKECSVGSEYSVTDPKLVLYDGESIWVSYNDDRLEKVSTDGNIEATISVPPFIGDYIRVMEFDGTYIWLGANKVDSSGSSVYKINPEGAVTGDSKVGVCSNNPTTNCNFSSDCGGNACNAVIAGSYPIYHVSGSCSDGSTIPGDHCMKDADCDGGTCDGMGSNVRTLTFDGTHMWVTNSAYGDHNSSGSECQDGLDNDGNGMCDFDGATGNPGCSGRPDPGCDDASDTMERSEYYVKVHLTRLVAATGQIVESIPVRTMRSDYQVNDAVFDGSSIWLGGRNFDRNTLAQYYSGSGLGLTDLAGSVGLFASNMSTFQPGSFSIAGVAGFGADFTVVGDMVVSGNTWGTSVEGTPAFGDGCIDGEFVVGIDATDENLECRPL